MTRNSEGIFCKGRELALSNLLVANDVDVMIITEAEIPAGSQGNFNVEGYTSFLPHTSYLLKTAKYRVVAMVWSALATSAKLRPDLMHVSVQLVWVQLDIQERLQGTPGPHGTRESLGT
jgi:hypothetical protein